MEITSDKNDHHSAAASPVRIASSEAGVRHEWSGPTKIERKFHRQGKKNDFSLDNITIRSMVSEDFKEFMKISNESYHPVKSDSTDVYWTKRGKPTTPNDSERKGWWDWAVDLASKNKAVFIKAEEDKEMVCWCFVIPYRTIESEESHNGILGIRTSQWYRGWGIGTKTIATALDNAKKIGFERVELDVMATIPETNITNPQIENLYGRAGFRQYGRANGSVKREFFYGQGYIDIVEMQLWLIIPIREMLGKDGFVKAMDVAMHKQLGRGIVDTPLDDTNNFMVEFGGINYMDNMKSLVERMLKSYNTKGERARQDARNYLLKELDSADNKFGSLERE